MQQHNLHNNIDIDNKNSREVITLIYLKYKLYTNINTHIFIYPIMSVKYICYNKRLSAIIKDYKFFFLMMIVFLIIQGLLNKE